MPSTVYALLVGIDQYQPPVRPLKGCVNDVRAFESLLRERVGGDRRLKLLTLTDADATRQRVIDAFRDHLGRARHGDVALFYYSGHGSQQPTPPALWHLEPDRLDETIVCHDSRAPGGWDLADKELAKLIAGVAANEPHLVVILDCCHSGSGTRAPGDVGEARRAPTDTRQRPLHSYIVAPDELPPPAATRSAEQPRESITTGGGRHVVLSACRADEEAREYTLGGQRRGAFSYFLADTLQRGGASLTYRDLFKRASALVRANVSAQSPVIESIDPADLDQPFLGGAVASRAPYFTASFDPTHGWVIDGGRVHGLADPAADETTILALYPLDATHADLLDPQRVVADARVTAVLPNLAKIDITMRDGSSPDLTHTFKAIVVSQPLPPLAVTLEGAESRLGAIRAAIAASSYLRESSGDEAADVRVIAEAARFVIARAGDRRPLVSPLEGDAESAARRLVARLEHLARWQTVAQLANPAAQLDPGAIELEILRVAGPPVTRDPASAPLESLPPSAELRFDYVYRNGRWQQPAFKIRLRNRSDQRLYCALLDLSERYAIGSGLLPGGGVWLDPGAEAWANAGNPIYPAVPDELWREGITEFADLIKLIASTDEFDATLLEQPRLDLPYESRATRSAAPRSTLERLMSRVGTRDLGLMPSDHEPRADWITSEVTITTVRPLEATPIPAEGNAALLGAGVKIRSHPALRARARLTTAATASRDLGAPPLPPLLADDPLVAQPFAFSEGRGSDPGLSVLELIDVGDHEAVTEAQPLVVQLDAALDAGEAILPYAYDGEFWLPLGRSSVSDGLTQIELDRLPPPVAGARSLLGSIRIFFQKVAVERVGKLLGWEYRYPLLAAAYVDRAGEVTYWPEPADVRARVAAAERIVLYIHGIIGDTRGMAASARALGLDVAPLIDRYDLILTHDYENINTTIEDNARLLKQRLIDVGLGPGHGKTLHVVAHSMGGLVARWMIEREGGDRMVQRLVLLGTPNAGSPWPKIQDLATTALALGLNGLTATFWPAKVLGTLVGAIEKIDVALDQMAPGSDVLKTLATSPDPGIPYTIIAGNTSIIPAARESADGSESRMERLLKRLMPGNALRAATALAFFGAPNDIAVHVRSICAVPEDRSPAPAIVQTPCDHITYFNSVAGLRALAEALARD